MPRPDTLLPDWSWRGEGRGCQPDFSATVLSSAMSRGSLTWRNRNSIGSTFWVAATSSIKDSLAKWICGPTGSRKCEVRNGDDRSSNGGIVSPPARFLSEKQDSPGIPKPSPDLSSPPRDCPASVSNGLLPFVSPSTREN